MSRPTKVLLSCLSYLSVLVLGLTSCDKKFDEYYARPADLAPPIYQELEQRGNFTNFLAVIEKARYKQILSSAGYWTIFAPTDEAFQKFYTERGLSGVDAVDSLMAQKIVAYSLVYNAFTRERLNDYQSSIGWVENEAYKRRTAYYTGMEKKAISHEDLPAGEVQVVSANRNGGAYVAEDNNNKYIPFFTERYFTAKGLSAADYTVFYPGVPFTGFNVAHAAVLSTPRNLAENGIIHVVDRVIMPIPSIDEYLPTKPEYSMFRNLLEKYGATYAVSPLATEKWNKIKKTSGDVFVKSYGSNMAFFPGNENFLKQMDNDAQTDGWSIFVPTNQALTKYIDEVLLEHYESLDDMNPQIIYDFLNAHMWQTTVWPSKFSQTSNFVGEPARFNLATDVVDPKALSNGMFYGTSKVQESDAFHSIFGKVYLDPKYSLMSTFLQRELRNTVSNPNVRFTMFLVSDEMLEDGNYSYDEVNNTWLFNNSTNGAVDRLNRLFNSHLAVTFENELNDLSGEGIIPTFQGELIKYKNNRVYAAGNMEVDPDNLPRVTARKVGTNGIVYYLDKPLLFPEKQIGFHLEKHPQFSEFFDYLKNSAIYNATTNEIAGVAPGGFFTYFIPSNQAIAAAVADKVLPASKTPTSQADKDKVIAFLQYHILTRAAIIPDGKEEGRFETMYKTVRDQSPTTLTVVNEPNMLQVTDMAGKTANLIKANSNVLANRSVIHSIDKYLQPVE